MTQETQQLTAETLPETEAAAPDATADALTSDAPAEETAPAQPPVASKWGDDPYEAYEHEDFKPLRERDQRRIEERLEGEIGARYAEQQRNFESSELRRNLASYAGRFLEAMENGNVDAGGRMLDRINEMLEPYNATAAQNFRNEGANNNVAYVLKEMKENVGKMDLRTQDAFEDAINSPRRTWSSIFSAYVDAHTSKIESKYKAQLAERDKTIEELKANVREGQGPNGAAMTQSRAGGSGIRSMDDADLAYSQGKISTEEYREARDRFGIKTR